MNMNLMYELVEIVFMTRTEINKCLNCLVGIRGDFLPLASFDGLDCVVSKRGKVCDTVVHVRRLVHADKWFVEDSKEIAEELKRGRLYALANFPLLRDKTWRTDLFDDLQHHEFVTLSKAQLEILLEMREELSALS